MIGFHQPLQVLRYTKVSHQLWLINIDKIYQIESFLNRLSTSVVYLVDDKKIPSDEWSNQRMETCHAGGGGQRAHQMGQSHQYQQQQHHVIKGVNELQYEFEQRKMFVTSWPTHLHDQLIGFVNNWNISHQQYEEQKRNGLLHDDRHSPPSPSSMTRNDDVGLSLPQQQTCDPPTLLSLWNSGPISFPSSLTTGVGVLAYEISLQHGIVIRTDTTNEANTMWTMMYLHDILPSAVASSTGSSSVVSSSSSSSWTCYDFFCLIFPQFALLSSHLIQGEGLGEAAGKKRVGIKYLAHPMTNGNSSTSHSGGYDEPSSPLSVSTLQGASHGPPSKPILSAYQTIGLLSDPATKIIPRSPPPHSSSASSSSLPC
jgi:hypothetical protein